jgi:macrodomain Ter protein organizer (MatP/YcbG family)
VGRGANLLNNFQRFFQGIALKKKKFFERAGFATRKWVVDLEYFKETWSSLTVRLNVSDNVPEVHMLFDHL